MILFNEYSGFCFELNFELNHFSAQFNEKMNSYRQPLQAGDRVGGLRLSSGSLEPPQATSGHLPQTAQDNVPEKCGLSKRVTP